MTEHTSRRKRGAQPGNTNAFKLKPPQRTKSPSSGSAAHIGVRPKTSVHTDHLLGTAETNTVMALIAGAVAAVSEEMGSAHPCSYSFRFVLFKKRISKTSSKYF